MKIDGPTTYDSNGELLFVTVRTPELSLLDWWVGRNNPAVDEKSYSDLYATETPQQQTTRGQRDMRTAKETAEYVALKRLGFDAKLTPGEVIIDELVCLKASDDGRKCVQTAPSDELLNPGDKLLKVDGKPLSVVDDIAPILANHKAGDTVTVDYERDGKPGSGTITLIAAPNEPERVDHRLHPQRHRDDQPARRRQGQHRHRIDRRPLGRVGVHVDDDRPVVAGRPAGWQASRGDRHDQHQR